MANIQHPTVNYATALRLITEVIFAGGGIPYLAAKSGVGKTSMAALIAKIMNLEFDPAIHVANFSGSGPAEATGYGVPGPWDPSDDADLVLKFSAGKGIPTFQRYGFAPVLWVWDEYTNWPSEVIANSRGCVTPPGFPKKWGEHIIAPNVHILITGNRRMDGSRQSVVLDAPNMARVTQLLLEPTLTEWLQWAAGEGFNASDHFTWLQFINMGANDLSSNAALEARKFFAPDPVTPWNGEPYPCPRQHERACLYTMADAPLLDMDHSAKVIALSGLLGPEAGTASAAWSTVMKESVGKAKEVLGGTTPMPKGPADAFPVLMAAYRMERKRSLALDPMQRQAAVKGGDFDSLVERVILPAPGELRRCVFEQAIRPIDGVDGDCSIPLDMHPKAGAMQGL